MITLLMNLKDFLRRTFFNEKSRPVAQDRLATPLVSVIVVSYAYGHYVCDAVESVISQTYPNIEVIVVEGGSVDPEFDAFATSAPSSVKILRRLTPHRVGNNRNFGIRHSSGDLICCLDADDALDPTYIEKATTKILENGYDLVSCGVEYVGERSGAEFLKLEPDLSDLVNANNVLTCAVFRRELWSSSGGYIEAQEYDVTHEDWCFWVRLAALGAKIYNIQEPLLKYRVHKSGLSNRRNELTNSQHAELIRKINADVLNKYNFS